MYDFYNTRIELPSPDEVLVYLRKSRTDDPSLTVEEILKKHEQILDEWATRVLGAPVPESNKYREVVSGETIADRPDMQRILKRIESPKIKGILTVEVQRLSRGDLEDAGRLIKILRYTDTLVLTPQKIYDITNEYDRDAFERELKRGNEYLEYIKKIMSRGTYLSVSQGNYVGSIPPYGYDKAWVMDGKRKCPTLSINEEQAEVVRMIFNMYVNEDKGTVYISHYLDSMGIAPQKGKHWSRDYILGMLENVHYIGKIKWNYRKVVNIVENSEIVKTRPKNKAGEYLIFDGKHEAIISEELFKAAQEKRGKHIKLRPNTKRRNPFAGLVFCRCGRAMTYRTYKNKNGKERCKPRLVCDDQTRCHSGSCQFDEMIPLIAEALKKQIADFEILKQKHSNAAAENHEKLIKKLEKKLAELEEKELSMWEAQAHPDPAQRMPGDIFKRLNEKLTAEKKETEKALSIAYKTKPTREDYDEKIFRFKVALNAMYDTDMDDEQKNKLLRACIERIDYSREAPHRLTGPRICPNPDTEQPEWIKNIKNTPNENTIIATSKEDLAPKRWSSEPISLNINLKI